MAETSTTKWSTIVEVVASLGLVTGIGYFLVWNEQSGFYGAFSVTPEQVGVTSGTRIERLSLAAAVVISVIAMVTVGTELRLIWRRLPSFRKKIKADHSYSLSLFIGAILLAGIIIQVAIDKVLNHTVGIKHSIQACVFIVLATAVALLGRRRWKTGNHPLITVVVTVTFLVALIGWAVNAWAYDLGNKFRDGNQSKATFLIGKTPPKAVLKCRQTPTCGLPSTEVLFLGEANDQFVVYDIAAENALLIPRDEAEVRITPHK